MRDVSDKSVSESGWSAPWGVCRSPRLVGVGAWLVCLFFVCVSLPAAEFQLDEAQSSITLSVHVRAVAGPHKVTRSDAGETTVVLDGQLYREANATDYDESNLVYYLSSASASAKSEYYPYNLYNLWEFFIGGIGTALPAQIGSAEATVEISGQVVWSIVPTEPYEYVGKPVKVLVDAEGSAGGGTWDVLSFSLSVGDNEWGPLTFHHVGEGEAMYYSLIDSITVENVKIGDTATCTFAVRLELKDNSGGGIGGGGNLVMSFMESTPPKACFSYSPAAGVTGKAITFDASCSEPKDVYYIWDFGDNTAPLVTTDPEVSHIFAAPGEYEVALTVTDQGGSDVCTRTVRVINELPPMKGRPRDGKAEEVEPVNITNGNTYIIKTDLSTPSPGMPFTFTRTYNSIEEADGPLGAGWTHNFNINMTPPADDNSSAVINDADGRVITFIQPSPGQFQPVAGEHSTLVQNSSGYLWEKKDKTRYQFNTDGVLQSITDRNGNTLSLTHDSQGNLTSITDTAGRVYNLTYDGNGHITSIVDPTGRTVTYQYDANGNLIQVTDPAGVITTYEYNDPNDPHNITKQTIGGDFIYTYSYDDQDRCIQAQGPNGENGESFAYHPEDNYTVITDSKGQQKTKYYNVYGEVTKITYPDGTEEDFTWDENLNRTSATKQDGSTWQYEYDERGNLTKVTDPMGHQRTMAYDDNDNLTSLTDERGHTTTYSYDTKGNLTQITFPDGKTTTFTYNSRGQLLTLTDAKGKTTTYAYDSQGNLVSSTDSLGNTITYQYDALGRRTSMTDAKGNTTTYQYDALNRIIKTTDALGGNVTTTYTQAGMASLTDPNNNLTSFQYDVLNQLTGITDPLGKAKSLAYDTNGNLATRTDYKGVSTTYDYDNLNRLTAIHYPDGSQVSFTYDAAGRMTSMTDSLGTSSYSYDSLGRLTSYTNPYGQSVSYSYDEAGNLLTLTYPGNKVVTYAYDASNRLTTVTDWAGRQTTYSYDQGGDLTQVTLPNGSKVQYIYDDAGRITSLKNLTSGDQPIATYTYTLDKNGNIVKEEADQPLDPSIQPESVAYTYGAGNRLLHAGTDDLTYDKNGNLITKGTSSYQYDHENRLIQVTTSQGTWEYGYDGMGNRLMVKENGNERRFLIDPRGMTRVLVGYDGSNTLKAYYIYGLGLLYKVDASGDAYYYHYNFTGNTVAMTDQAENIVNKYAYTPYGVLAGKEETVSNPFRYVGRFGVMDDESGLLYMRARYYDPELGRFITKDPIGFGGGVNLYGYSLSNPIAYTDPSGYCVKSLKKALLYSLEKLMDLIETTYGSVGDFITSVKLMRINPGSSDALWKLGDLIDMTPPGSDLERFTNEIYEQPNKPIPLDIENAEWTAYEVTIYDQSGRKIGYFHSLTKQQFEAWEKARCNT